jgi:hypothetical protein
MRGQDAQQAAMFSYVGLEERIPADHPLRAIRAMADRALRVPTARPGELWGHSSARPHRHEVVCIVQRTREEGWHDPSCVW